MKLKTLYQCIFYLLVGYATGFASATFLLPVKTEIKIYTPSMEKVVPYDTIPSLDILNDSTLMAELVRQEVKFPEIVRAQARLETGFYTSRLCKKHNNLFGLRHRKGYYKFKTWQESVTAYKKYIQYKYKGGDYFKFLERIGYAEGSSYTKYVKDLM